jgi:hypothetical protein
MTKTEQNRVLAWRLKLLQEASGCAEERSLRLPSFRPLSQNLL